MSKTSYLFLIVIVGLALLVHAFDEHHQDVAISKAAGIALHDGVLEACEQRNHLRDSILSTASALHPESRRDSLRLGLNYEDCDVLSEVAVEDFFRRLRETE